MEEALAAARRVRSVEGAWALGADLQRRHGAGRLLAVAAVAAALLAVLAPLLALAAGPAAAVYLYARHAGGGATGAAGAAEEEVEAKKAPAAPERKAGETAGEAASPPSPAPPRPAAPSAAAPEKKAPRGATGPAMMRAMMAQKRAAAEAAKRPKPKPAEQRQAVIAYASQTGTCESIAKVIGAEAAQRGIPAKVQSLNEISFDDMTAATHPVWVLVSASTGDGDPPDNATSFYAKLLRTSDKAPEKLKGATFTALGLGDSNYTRFMYVPRTLKKGFERMGAAPFHKCVEADEVDGIEETVDPWIESIMGPLKGEVLGNKENAGPRNAPAAGAGAAPAVAVKGVPALLPCTVELLWDKDPPVDALERTGGAVSALNPFLAPVQYSYNMVDPNSDRRVMHMELDIRDSGLAYGAGDAFGVLAPNREELVDAVLKRLGQDGGRAFSVRARAGGETGGKPLAHLGWPCTLRYAFLHRVDLTSPPKKQFLRVLAEYCGVEKERAALLRLCGAAGKEAYRELVAEQPTLLVLLETYNSCRPPLGHLLEALPKLNPRMYSLSSAPAAHPDALHFAFSVVDYTSPAGRPRKGVATTWLHEIGSERALGSTEDVRVPIYLRPGGAFRPPRDLARHVVMVGPGTGVAPFRGFLQERRAALRGVAPAGATCGEAWLFFGCRRASEDYLYREDFEGFRRDGTLTELVTAFSREQARKVYVQHRMREHGARLRELIFEQDAYVFVCGDGAHMAKAVHEALVEIGGPGAAERLKEATKGGRYVRDVWS